ncbi:ABC transporter permease [Streptomyces sp. NPDC002454]|uniref:ABC transporter permease n=1 Tax=Streptomyces sp. NPDC002490 TaxID=3154416 RepID=UPI00331820C5
MSAFRAELTKMRTVRAVPSSLLATVAVGGAGAVVFGRALRGQTPFDPIFASYYGLTLAQVALVVFGVLVIGGEYATGTVRTALLAVPDRGRFHAAKVAAVTAVLAVVSLVTVVVAFVAGQWALGPQGVGWGDPHTYRAAVGAWLYLVLIGLFAFGVATVVRTPGRALGLLVPLLLLGSQGLGNVPRVRTVTQFLPDAAGSFIMHMAGVPEDPFVPRAYGPWQGTGILALWALAALLAGHLALRHRDVR